MGIRDSLTGAAKLLGVQSQFNLVAPHRFQDILEGIISSRTTLGKEATSALWWWESLREPVASVKPLNAVEILKDLFHTNESVWFVAEDRGQKKLGNFWLYDTNVSTVCALLNEMPAFEYYVVAKKFDWLVCENHHGYLIASGEPMATRIKRLQA